MEEEGGDEEEAVTDITNWEMSDGTAQNEGGVRW